MYLIYEKESTRIVRIMRQNFWQDAQYKSEGAAKAGFSRLAKQGKVAHATHAILEAAEFRKIEKTETKRNLLSGKEFTQSVNTPLCCDPSTDTYWSM